MREETRRWLRYAEDDLDAAADMAAVGRWNMVAYQCQQAEKALKAILVEAGSESPRTHDLVLLGRRVSLPVGSEQALDGLTRAYNVSRYPDAADAEVERANEEDAREYVRAAEVIAQWAKEQLSTPS